MPRLQATCPDTARGLAKERRRRGLRWDLDLALQQFVVDHLCSFQWSPEPIAGHLKYRQTKLRSLSHETIDAWIYTKPKEKLWRHLLRRKVKRGLKKYRSAGVSRLPERTSIHQRPPCVGFGHFEGDLMSCRKGTQNMLVFHARKTRFIQAIRLTNKTAQATAAAGLKLLECLPKERLKSLTLDNGGAFAKHTEWVQKLGLLRPIFVILMRPGKKVASRTQMDVCAETCPGKQIFRHSRRRNSMKSPHP